MGIRCPDLSPDNLPIGGEGGELEVDVRYCAVARRMSYERCAPSFWMAENVRSDAALPVRSPPFVEEPPIAERDQFGWLRVPAARSVESIHSSGPSSSAKMPMGVSSSTQWPFASAYSVRHFS